MAMGNGRLSDTAAVVTGSRLRHDSKSGKTKTFAVPEVEAVTNNNGDRIYWVTDLQFNAHRVTKGRSFDSFQLWQYNIKITST